MDPSEETRDSIRLQAEEHPLIDDVPATSPAEHCLRLMHLKSYAEATALAAGRDVLDVGCNTGYGTIQLTATAGRVVGVDVSPRAIEVAKAAATDGRPEFLAIDGLTLPFADASFDLIISFQVIEHVQDPVPYLREIARVARKGAIVLLATPNAATRLDPGMTPWNKFHVREYLAPELDTLLRSVFASVRVRGMFATPTLYETEIDRVDAARRRIRRTMAAAAAATVSAATASAPTSTHRVRQIPIRIGRTVVPARTRSWLRSALLRRPTPPPRAVTPTPTMDLATFLRFTIDDLYYADHDLERAMDLLAVCGVDP